MTKVQKTVMVWMFVLFSLIVGSDPVMASSNFPGIFNTLYPASRSGTNASCRLCHTTSTAALNQYGQDWAEEFRNLGTEAAAFAAVENLNSDNDPKGVTNIREINASSQPGWTLGPNNTTYDRDTGVVLATTASPPATASTYIDPGAKVAVFRSSSSTFYLDLNGTGAYNGCTTDRCAAFGSAGDIPVLGDWSGIGTAQVGVFRPSAGTFYLDYNGDGSYNGCVTDRCIAFGVSGDIPLVGDWNGNGTTKVGVYRPSSGTFYLDHNGNGLYDGCAVDTCVTGGDASDIPLVGDWNASGTTKVGVFRPSAAAFALDYDGNGIFDGCVADKCFAFGVSTDTPFVGDWNGDGTTKVGVYRVSDFAFYLDYNGDGLWDGCATDKCLGFGGAGDTPLVGDWSGNGTTKVGAFRPSAGSFYLDYDGNGGWDGCTTDKCFAFGSTGDTPLIAPR